MFKDVFRKLQLAQIVPQNVNACFGNCDVITLGDMDVSMSHLITEQVCGRVHFSHECSISVAENVILEIDTQFALYLTGGVFEGIDGLNCAVG